MADSIPSPSPEIQNRFLESNGLSLVYWKLVELYLASIPPKPPQRVESARHYAERGEGLPAGDGDRVALDALYDGFYHRLLQPAALHYQFHPDRRADLDALLSCATEADLSSRLAALAGLDPAWDKVRKAFDYPFSTLETWGVKLSTNLAAAFAAHPAPGAAPAAPPPASSSPAAPPPAAPAPAKPASAPPTAPSSPAPRPASAPAAPKASGGAPPAPASPPPGPSPSRSGPSAPAPAASGAPPSARSSRSVSATAPPPAPARAPSAELAALQAQVELLRKEVARLDRLMGERSASSGSRVLARAAEIEAIPLDPEMVSSTPRARRASKPAPRQPTAASKPAPPAPSGSSPPRAPPAAPPPRPASVPDMPPAPSARSPSPLPPASSREELLARLRKTYLPKDAPDGASDEKGA